jgi:amino acid transporter
MQPGGSGRDLLGGKTSFVPTGTDSINPSGFGASALARRRLGVGSLVFFTVSASAPMTVIGGGVVAMFAATGLVGVPLAFPILAVALGLFAVGYAAMSRHVVNAGVFYAYISQGLGGVWGVAASFTALISYNAIQISLYGLFGAAVGGFVDAKTGLTWSWEVWAFIGMALVAVLGVLRVDLNAKLLSVLLLLEIAAVLIFDLGAFTHPAGGSISFDGLEPKNLFVSGIGGVMAFGIAAFVGFESAGDYAEEAKNPRSTVGRALAVAIAITGVLYTVSAWAVSVGVGADKVVDAARDPQSGIPFSTMAQIFGSVFADVANVLLLTSIFAALLSFHNTVARYLYSAGRERVLPRIMARTGSRSSAPFVGSITQTILALIVVSIFALAGKDPILALFTWASYVSGLGILALMVGTSIAVMVYLNRHRDTETLWQRTIAPILAILALGAVLYVSAVNASVLLGTDDHSALVWILPGLVVAGIVVGLVWGAVLRSTNPVVYAGIGKGGPTDD